MLQIECPWCGKRDQTEFSYGGEAHIDRPAQPAALQARSRARARGVQPGPRPARVRRDGSPPRSGSSYERPSGLESNPPGVVGIGVPPRNPLARSGANAGEGGQSRWGGASQGRDRGPESRFLRSLKRVQVRRVYSQARHQRRSTPRLRSKTEATTCGDSAQRRCSLPPASRVPCYRLRP